MPARLRAEMACRLRRVAGSGDAGSSTTEATLITPLLVAVLLLLVLCGRLVSAKLDLQAAASAATVSPAFGSRCRRGRAWRLGTLDSISPGL